VRTNVVTPPGVRRLHWVVDVDAELIARVRGGDARAFDALVGRHAEVCWRFAFRLLGHRADAEDAVQDTWLRASRALSRYHEQSQFRSWLFQILVNECRRVQERRARERMRLADDPDALRTVSAKPAQADLHDALQRGLARLDLAQREAVLLKYGEGLEYEEISRLTGCSVSALKMRVLRGRETLRQFFEAEGVHEGGFDE
jgi:RNA polymerase sigma-70 factor, ECF subfamily